MSPAGDAACGRRTDIEALRISVCALVVLLHALLIYGPQPYYHLKAPTVSAGAGIAAEALRVLLMPLFFIIAGWSAVLSLRRRDARAFLIERARRIVVPLLTGMGLVCPLIKFIELRGGRDMRPAGFRLVAPLTDDFWTFLPRFFVRVADTTWSHLWFLVYLLVLSVLLLPVLLRAARMTPLATRPPAWTLLLPGAALGLLVWLVDGYWPYYPNLYRDLGNLGYYAACMGLGAALAAWPGLVARLGSAWPAMMLAAWLGFAGVALLGEIPAGRVCVGFAAWCGSAALIGWVSRHPPRRSPWLDAVGEATLPVYVLHHLPVLVLGLLMLQTDLPWPVQVGSIWGAALVVSAVIYQLLVRPWGPMRVLFGMPWHDRADQTGGSSDAHPATRRSGFERRAAGPARR